MVKSLAADCGFVACGVTDCEPIDPPVVQRMRRWAHSELSDELGYLRRNEPLRADPQMLLNEARSVLCLALPCNFPAADLPADHGRIARYARGREYHKQAKKRCGKLLEAVRRELEADLVARIFVDSAPVMERSLAVRAGLGWVGRNGCLIVPGAGSFVLLAEVFWSLALPADAPTTRSCEECYQCVRACPGEALCGDGLLDARRCVSWRTEKPGDVPEQFRPAMGASLWGCDICQQVCPHNQAAPVFDEQLLGPDPIADLPLEQVLGWEADDWDRFTRGRALRAAPLEVLQRNAAIAAGNVGSRDLLGPLAELARRRPELAGIVDWAARRITSAPIR